MKGWGKEHKKHNKGHKRHKKAFLRFLCLRFEPFVYFLRQPFREVFEHFFCCSLNLLFILRRFFRGGIRGNTTPHDAVRSQIEEVYDQRADVVRLFDSSSSSPSTPCPSRREPRLKPFT